MTVWTAVASVLGSLAVGAVAGSAAFGLTAAILYGLRAVDAGPATPHPPVLGTVALLGLLAAVEEAIFRAGLLGLGQRVLPLQVVFPVSLLAFAAVHAVGQRLTAVAWVTVAMSGAVLGLLYLGGGFWAAWGFHWAWNAWQWGLGFTVSGPNNGGRLPAPPRRRTVRRLPYGPEGHWASLVALTAVLPALLLWYRM